MKFKKISTKMIVIILPVVIVAMFLLAIISTKTSKTLINEQTDDHMQAELDAKETALCEYLSCVATMANTISAMVETGYTTMEMKDLETILGNVILTNDIVLGSGLWFEPYAFDANEKYMGPYVYKDGDSLVTTYDYSNADYNYFEQEYYTMCIEATEAQFTDPYYDPTSDTVMSSCAAPIIANGKFVGCVTVDIELSALTKLVNEIKVGENGTAILLTGSGVYIAGVDSEKVANAMNICDEANASLAAAAKQILANETGEASYSDGSEMLLYYATMDVSGWKLIIQMPQSELMSAVNRLMLQLFIVSLFATIVTVAVVVVLVRSISVSIKGVNVFAESLADGDFTVPSLSIKGRDELAGMGTALNSMYESNKNMIGNIKANATEINASADRLNEASENLTRKFNEITNYMNDVNNAMLSTSAATEEVNASSEEVLSNTNYLVTETSESKQMALEIRGRAAEVGESSRASYESATALAKEFEQKLATSMENAKVVDSIGLLASAISDIAEQINLLSLNASIEAARAGDAGRGFAVVASEIGSLANSTSSTVDEIQKTIRDVQNAFNGLMGEAQELLDFLVKTVAPDYSRFVDVAEQYGKDAESIENTSDKISEMADSIKYIMQEVADAIQSITEATQNTTELSNGILRNIDEVSESVNEVATMSEEQADVAGNLNDVVSKFKI